MSRATETSSGSAIDPRGFAPKAWGYLVAVPLVVFYAPLFFGGQLYRRDAWRMLVACRDFIGTELRRGEFPGWFPFEGLGAPFHAQAVCGVLHPLSWLAAIVRPEIALTIQSLTAVGLAAFGTWRLARTLGASPMGSAVAAITFALSGYLTALSANVVYLWGASLLPCQMAACAAAGVSGWNMRRMVGAVAATASVALIGDLEGVYLFTAFAVATGWALAPRQEWVRYGTGVAWLGVLSIGLSAPQLLPSLRMFSESRRMAGLSWSEVSVWSLHPLRIPELLLAGMSPIGSALRTGMLGGTPGYLLWAEALGGSATVTALAVSALAHAGASRRARWVLSMGAVAGLLLAMGRFGGLYRVLFTVLPGMNSFRWPEKLVPLFLCPWSVLGGLGLTAAAGGTPAIRRTLWRIAAAWIGLAGASGFLTQTGRLGDAFQAYLWRLALCAAVAGAATVVLSSLLIRGARLREAGIAALVLAEVWFSAHGAYAARPLSDSLIPPKTVALLDQMGVKLGKARATNLGTSMYPLDGSQMFTPAERDRADFDRSLLIGLQGALYRREVVQTYFQGYSPDAARLLSGGALFFQRLARRYNVAAVLTRPENGRWLEGTFDETRTTGTGVSVFRLRDPWPRVYLAGAVPDSGGVEWEARLQRLSDLAPGQVLLAGGVETEPPATGTVAVEQYDTQRVEVSANTHAPAFLVLNDLFSPGWHAFVDGQSVPISRANVIVRAVRVPPGTHRVVFQYSTPWLGIGAWLAGAALLLLFCWPWLPFSWRGMRT